MTKNVKTLDTILHGSLQSMICQQVTLSGDAEWPKVADAVIEAHIPELLVGDILWLLCRCSVPIVTVPRWCNTGNRPMGPSAIAATIPTVRASFFFYNITTKGGCR